MFELNLIKEKALARQRRRIIFLSIVSVFLLSGLLSIFVGGLFWTEFTEHKNVEVQIQSTNEIVLEMDRRVRTEEPIARARRNGLIRAWGESRTVRQDRPLFTPVLRDLAEHYPERTEFWYNQISIRQLDRPAGTGSEVAPFAASRGLMGPRALEANGYILVDQSDLITESELRQLGQRMEGMIRLLGEPRFNLDLLAGRDQDRDDRRYAAFSMQAAQRTARSTAVID